MIQFIPSTQEDSLKAIFQIQKNLLDSYIQYTGWYKYPLPGITQPENQKILKELIGLLVGELSEAYEAYTNLQSYSLGLPPDTLEDEASKVGDMVAALNEELMDVLHFFMELGIYANIEATDVLSFYDFVLGPLNLKDNLYFGENGIITALAVARHENIQEGFYLRGITCRKIFYKEFLYESDYPFLNTSRHVGAGIYELFLSICWEITSRLNVSVNKLRTKYVKEAQVSINQFHTTYMECFGLYFRLLDIMGFTPEFISLAYEEKARINIHRLNEKLKV